MHGRKTRGVSAPLCECSIPLLQELTWQQLWLFLMKQSKSKIGLSAFVLPLWGCGRTDNI